MSQGCVYRVYRGAFRAAGPPEAVVLLHSIHRVLGTGVIVIAAPLASTGAVRAQNPPALQSAFRAPVIALVQPAGGQSVPQDKPVVVLRFAAGESGDPIDLATLTVTVDGADRTRLFQVTAGEAWGPLAPPARAPNDSALAPGTYQLTARICSARGACGETAVAVNVAPASIPKTDGATDKIAVSRRQRLIDALLSVARKLLTP